MEILVHVVTGTASATLTHGNGVVETLGPGQSHNFHIIDGAVSITTGADKRRRKTGVELNAEPKPKPKRRRRVAAK